MSFLCVTYDLAERGPQNYLPIEHVLEQFDHRHTFKSTWFVRTNSSPKQVYDLLEPYIVQADRLAVFVVDPAKLYGWLDKSTLAWMGIL